ncbi:MAG: DUF1902 domain-containing protein [Clostridiales bacterium]|jgi:hypothetical protein|nr:DUF1902 domain-containing protein [Clostridiales bacterium]
MSEYVIKLVWDSEACVWIATSEDVPGLVLESGSYDALIERVRMTVPDLLGKEYKDISIHFTAERYEKAYA